MEKIKIMLIILQKCNDVDKRLIYRCLNSKRVICTQKDIVANCKNVKKTFEKKECQKIFDMKLYMYYLFFVSVTL